ncbi:NAD(P)-binding domain-containing protein [Sneathiella chinensis]|nr:NAD(P)-binding domain-containing protein [Sneathiella chinensis]
MGLLKGMAVGFVGVGPTGTPMARNILSAGASTFIYSRTPSIRYELARSGFHLCQSPAEIAEKTAGGTILILAGGSDAPSLIAEGEDNLLDVLHPDTLVVDLRTGAQTQAESYTLRADEKGAHWLTAELVRTKSAPDTVQEIRVHGPLAIFKRALPVLNCLSDTVRHLEGAENS